MAQNLSELGRSARRASQTVKAIKSAGFPVTLDKSSLDDVAKIIASAVERGIARAASEAGSREIAMAEPPSVEDMRAAFSDALAELKIEVPKQPPPTKPPPRKPPRYRVDNIATDRNGNILSFDMNPIG